MRCTCSVRGAGTHPDGSSTSRTTGLWRRCTLSPEGAPLLCVCAPIHGRRHTIAATQPLKPRPVFAAHPGVKEVVLLLRLDAHQHATRIVCNPGAHHGGAVGYARGTRQLACRLVNAPGSEWQPAFTASAQRKHHGGERHLLLFRMPCASPRSRWASAPPKFGGGTTEKRTRRTYESQTHTSSLQRTAAGFGVCMGTKWFQPPPTLFYHLLYLVKSISRG